jgi:hypothetical protein
MGRVAAIIVAGLLLVVGVAIAQVEAPGCPPAKCVAVPLILSYPPPGATRVPTLAATQTRTTAPADATATPTGSPTASGTATATTTPSSTPTGVPTETVLRIDSGGGVAYTDVEGARWQADTGAIGGYIAERGTVVVEGASDPTIYRSERWGLSGYAIPLANGVYTVRLHFAEFKDYIDQPGERVFGVSVEGVTLGAIDVYAEAARQRNRALVRAVTVPVIDGQLDIVFTQIAENTMIHGIEILPGAVATPTGIPTWRPSRTPTRTPTATPTRTGTPTRTPTPTLALPYNAQLRNGSFEHVIEDPWDKYDVDRVMADTVPNGLRPRTGA